MVPVCGAVDDHSHFCLRRTQAHTHLTSLFCSHFAGVCLAFFSSYSQVSYVETDSQRSTRRSAVYARMEAVPFTDDMLGFLKGPHAFPLHDVQETL
jgi:hypothetical protein